MNLLIAGRWWLFAMLLLFTAIALPGLRTAMVPDNSLSVWFLETDPALRDYYRFHEQFGNDEFILLHVRDRDGIFERHTLQQLRSLITELDTVDGVRRVHSIFSARVSRLTDSGLEYDVLIPESIPDAPARLDAIRARLVSSEVYRGWLVSAEGTQVMLWIQMEARADFDARRDAVVQVVRDTVGRHLNRTEAALGGVGVIYSALNRATQRDFATFISLTYALMFGLLWWHFRNMRLVVATIGAMSVGTIMCLGIYGLLGRQLNMVTVLLPTLVIVLGVANTIHFLTAFSESSRSVTGERGHVANRALSRVLGPCVMTTLTTMAGFMALTSSPMVVIRDLGIFAAIGLGFALVASVALTLIAFISLPDNGLRPRGALVENILDRFERLVIRRPAQLGVIALVIGCTSLVGATRIHADTYTLGYLPDDHPVVVDHERIVDSWGAYFPIEFLVEPGNDQVVHSAGQLNRMEEFVREARKHPAIHAGMSLATVYRQAQRTATAEIDTGTRFTPQMIDRLERWMGRPETAFEWDPAVPEYRDNVLAEFMTQDGTLGRITLIGTMMSANELGNVIDEINTTATAVFGESASVRPTGYTPLYVRIIEYVMESQVQAFFIALALITMLMMLWLRSIRLTAISIVANVFPIVVMLGMMAALGQTLDIASATIAAIVLGVAIDDTIHFLYHWNEAENEGMDWQGCLHHAYRHAAKPAVITTILLVVGFSVLMLAQVKTVFYFGLLTSVAAVAALFADLILLPLLLRITARAGMGRT